MVFRLGRGFVERKIVNQLRINIQLRKIDTTKANFRKKELPPFAFPTTDVIVFI